MIHFLQLLLNECPLLGHINDCKLFQRTSDFKYGSSAAAIVRHWQKAETQPNGGLLQIIIPLTVAGSGCLSRLRSVLSTTAAASGCHSHCGFLPFRYILSISVCSITAVSLIQSSHPSSRTTPSRRMCVLGTQSTGIGGPWFDHFWQLHLNWTSSLRFVEENQISRVTFREWRVHWSEDGGLKPSTSPLVY